MNSWQPNTNPQAQPNGMNGPALRFDDLDLSGVTSDFGGMLRPGNYLCRITAANWKLNNARNGHNVELEFTDLGGRGTARTWLAVDHPNQDTVLGARRKLRALLESAGHMNPDRPGAIESLINLTVGVRIEGSTYLDRNTGEKRNGSQVADRGPFFKTDNEAYPIGPFEVQQPNTQPSPASAPNMPF